MWPFNSRGAWRLSDSLLRFSNRDAFSLADALEGVLVLGATGSGKSTGSGRALALRYLRAGFGGLVLTAKSDERALWEGYCRLAGRSQDLRIFSPRSGLKFNFLDYELRRPGAGAGLTENLVALFHEVLQIAERSGASSGREDESYWKRSCKQLLRNSIDLLVQAQGRLSVGDLYRVIISAPATPEQAKSESWKQSSFCYRCLKAADGRSKSDRQKHDLGLVADYFLLELPALSEKTRSVIVSTFTSMADVLNRGVLHELFGGATNITPEAVQQGAVLVIDLPVKEFGEAGLFAQVLWKTAFQRSIERRSIAANPRPVFLWADEAQNFVTSPNDMQFQTTCRAARVATVLLSQNISNFYAALGGSDKGRAEVDSLFANLGTKIFHANGDPVSNEWAASLIGRSKQILTSSSTNRPPADFWNVVTGMGNAPQTSVSVNEHIDFEVPPRAFTALRKGGPANRWAVDGIVFQGGRRFKSSGATWLPVVFNQQFKP